MDEAKIFGYIIAAILVLIPGIKWLISDWFKKSQEIQHLKNQHTKTALSRLEDDVKDFRICIDSIQATIRELSSSLVANKSEIITLKEKLDETKKHIDLYMKSSNDNMKNMIKTEIVELTKTLNMYRSKKHGN